MVEAVAVQRTSYRFVLVGAVAVAAVLYLVIRGMSGTTVYYMQVSELLSQSTVSQQVRVMGKVEAGSIKRGAQTITFRAVDATGSVPVTYSGVVPDIFADNVDVVVEGTYSPTGVFQANTLLAKCPSKFESASTGGSS